MVAETVKVMNCLQNFNHRRYNSTDTIQLAHVSDICITLLKVCRNVYLSASLWKACSLCRKGQNHQVCHYYLQSFENIVADCIFVEPGI